MTSNGAEWFIRIAFAVVGTVHLLPVAGLLGRTMLERAYGVNLGEGQDFVILLQHRALLFGLLACACFFSLTEPGYRLPVGIGVLVSMVGFIAIAAGQKHGTAIFNVVAIDIGATVLLLGGMALQFKARHAP